MNATPRAWHTTQGSRPKWRWNASKAMSFATGTMAGLPFSMHQGLGATSMQIGWPRKSGCVSCRLPGPRWQGGGVGARAKGEGAAGRDKGRASGGEYQGDYGRWGEWGCGGACWRRSRGCRRVCLLASSNPGVRWLPGTCFACPTQVCHPRRALAPCTTRPAHRWHTA